MAKNKRPSRKDSEQKIAEHGTWTVWRGKLIPSRGRPDKVFSLFRVVAEKIPFHCHPIADERKSWNGAMKSSTRRG